MSWVLLALLIITGALAAVSDIRNGFISNRLLGTAAVCGCALDIILYGFISPSDFACFAINAAIVAVVSIALFCMHIWAGGDTKLSCTCAVLFPALLYVEWSGTRFTLVSAVLGSFLLGYIYLLIDTLREIAAKKKRIPWRFLWAGLLHFVCSYAQILIYVIPVNLLCSVIAANYGIIPDSLWILVDMIAAWGLSRIRLLRRLIVTAVVLVLDILITVWLGKAMVSTNIWFYLGILIVAVSRIVLNQSVYQTIPTETVKPRMIIAMGNTIEFQKSRVKGLPGISTEDLRSRLTPDEAESVRRWGRSARGSEYITIVRKIPFAVFIVAAFAIYAAAGIIQW